MLGDTSQQLHLGSSVTLHSLWVWGTPSLTSQGLEQTPPMSQGHALTRL